MRPAATLYDDVIYLLGRYFNFQDALPRCQTVFTPRSFEFLKWRVGKKTCSAVSVRYNYRLAAGVLRNTGLNSLQLKRVQGHPHIIQQLMAAQLAPGNDTDGSKPPMALCLEFAPLGDLFKCKRGELGTICARQLFFPAILQTLAVGPRDLAILSRDERHHFNWHLPYTTAIQRV